MIDNGAKQVVAVRRAQAAVTNFVDLQIAALVEGSTYEISTKVEVISGENGLMLPATKMPWVHTISKVAMTLGNLAHMYDLTPESHIRSVVQAIMISDEEIGGSFESRLVSSPGLLV